MPSEKLDEGDDGSLLLIAVVGLDLLCPLNTNSNAPNAAYDASHRSKHERWISHLISLYLTVVTDIQIDKHVQLTPGISVRLVLLACPELL